MTKQVKKVPAIVMSRIVGYISPLHLWNAGKKMEFEDRRTYSWRKAVDKANA